ncbi:hypothetical protein L484_000071 [Morus notabilis]|nr:hypothetical protein L484_000071 [Morus notabilis]
MAMDARSGIDKAVTVARRRRGVSDDNTKSPYTFNAGANQHTSQLLPHDIAMNFFSPCDRWISPTNHL